MSDITLENYSDKSFAVFGKLDKYEPLLLKLGGKKNERLRGVNESSGLRTGWIFSLKHKAQVEKAIQEFDGTACSSSSSTPSLSVASSANEESKITKILNKFSSDIEALKADVSSLKRLYEKLSCNNTPSIVKRNKSSRSDSDAEQEDEELEQKLAATPSLIQRKR